LFILICNYPSVTEPNPDELAEAIRQQDRIERDDDIAEEIEHIQHITDDLAADADPDTGPEPSSAA
jgi:hypothetical protein